MIVKLLDYQKWSILEMEFIGNLISDTTERRTDGKQQTNCREVLRTDTSSVLQYLISSLFSYAILHIKKESDVRIPTYLV